MTILPSMVQKKLLSARNLIELLRRKFSEVVIKVKLMTISLPSEWYKSALS